MQRNALDFVQYLIDFTKFEIDRFCELLDGLVSLFRNKHLFDPDFVRTVQYALDIAKKSPSLHDFKERIDNSYKSHGVDWNMLEKQLSLSDMQRIGNEFITNAEKINKELGLNVPAAPFGHTNEIWEWMMREYQDGDKFFTYGTICDDSSPNAPVRSGYCMVRNNAIMIVMCLMRS